LEHAARSRKEVKEANGQKRAARPTVSPLNVRERE